MNISHKRILWSLALVTAVNSSAQAQMACESVFSLQTKTTVKESDKNVKAADMPPLNLSKVKAEPAPRDPKEIEKMAERTWAEGTLEAKVAHLQRVHRWMYYRFPGREAMVDRVMATLKTTVLFPENVKKPAVIDMFGFPGDGKTDMVTTLGQYLGLKARFVQVSVKDGQVGIGLEIFRSLSDVAMDGTQPPISFLVIDEFQKFKKVTDLNSEAKPVSESFVTQTRNDVSTTIDEVQQRKSFVRLLYDIYGNASEKAAPTKVIGSYAYDINYYATQVKQARIEVSNLVARIAERKEALSKQTEGNDKKALESDIKDSSDSLEKQKKIIANSEGPLRLLVRSLVKDYGEILGPFKDLSPQETVDQITMAPEAFLDFLNNTSEESPQFQRQYHYKQMITFLLGNPENTIREVKDKNKGMTMDADQYVESVRQIDNNKVREELFDEIFGADSAGLRQRLNVDQWSVMPPLGKSEWLHFVGRQVEVMQNQFAYIMERAGLKDVSLNIDQSVKDLLFSEAIIPTEGARVYFERSTKLTGNFISDLATRMVEAPADAKPQQIQWSFDPSQRKFIISGWRDGKLVFDERSPVASVSNGQKNTQLDNYDRIRLITQKAGQIVMGLATFKTLPTSFRFDLETTDASVTGLWSAPTKSRYTTTSDFINLALGANVSQNFMRDGFVSMGDPSLQFAHEMVRRMVNDLHLREMEYAFLVEKSENKKIYLENFPKPEGLSKDVLEALMEATSVLNTGKTKEENRALEAAAYGKVLRLMVRDINNTLQQNAELLRAIAKLMESRTALYEAGKIASPEITSADIETLVAQNRVYKKRPTLLNRLGITKMPETALITPDKLAKVSLGTIENKDGDFLSDNPAIQKARLWQRIWRTLFNRPFPQRPLTPQ